MLFPNKLKAEQVEKSANLLRFIREVRSHNKCCPANWREPEVNRENQNLQEQQPLWEWVGKPELQLKVQCGQVQELKAPEGSRHQESSILCEFYPGSLPSSHSEYWGKILLCFQKREGERNHFKICQSILSLSSALRRN